MRSSAVAACTPLPRWPVVALRLFHVGPCVLLGQIKQQHAYAIELFRSLFFIWPSTNCADAIIQFRSLWFLIWPRRPCTTGYESLFVMGRSSSTECSADHNWLRLWLYPVCDPKRSPVGRGRGPGETIALFVEVLGCCRPSLHKQTDGASHNTLFPNTKPPQCGPSPSVGPLCLVASSSPRRA